MVAGASSSATSYLPAFAPYALTMLVPIVVRLLATGHPIDAAMAVMIGLFGAAMGLLAYRAGRWFRQSTALRLGNAELITRLSQARDLLEAHVQERTAQLEDTVAQVREAEVLARAAVRARDEFLAMASHELRTPLTVLGLHFDTIRAWLESGGELDRAKLAARVPKVQRQIQRLTALVDRMLAVSGLAERTPVLQPSVVDVAEVVRAAVEDHVGHDDDTRRISLALEHGIVGDWDPIRIEQMVTNLVSNALKYGASAPVSVSLARSGGQVVLTVRDQGPGIAPQDQPRIFDRFFRADPSRGHAGLGLGLFVVRELANAMGGSVEVVSAPGQGAAFVVRLPAPRAAAAAAPVRR
jgi:signal transduction histidine kinase